VSPLRDPILLLNVFQLLDVRSPDAVREAYGILRFSVHPSAAGLPVTPISVPIFPTVSHIVPSDVAPVHVGSPQITERICHVPPIARRVFILAPFRNIISPIVVSGSTRGIWKREDIIRGRIYETQCRREGIIRETLEYEWIGTEDLRSHRESISRSISDCSISIEECISRDRTNTIYGTISCCSTISCDEYIIREGFISTECLSDDRDSSSIGRISSYERDIGASYHETIRIGRSIGECCDGRHS
jgi:hypothetical protein